MLKIIGTNEIYLDYDDYYAVEEYGGKDFIGFTLPLDHPGYKEIYEETPIVCTESGQRYLVKAIDEGAQTVNIKAEIDLDELAADMLIEYTNNSSTVLDTIANILPNGWSVQDYAHLNFRRTVKLEASTPLGVIDTCYNIYGIVCRFDNRARVVSIYNPQDGEPQGAYLTDELNLTAVNIKGKSNGFATRLYVRGKDGLTFATINNGKDYIDNHSYSDKVVSAYWKDERYTVVENLLADAKKKLAEMAAPQQSYTCNVVDLARIKERQDEKNANIYSFLDFSLYMPIVLIDRRRKRRVIHRVVQIKRYPHHPEKNEILLSTVAPSIQTTVKGVQEQIEKPTSTFNQIRQAQIEAQTDLITGKLGGNYIITTDPDTGKPNGWAVMDTDNTETAKNVWRMSLGGFGHSHNGLNGPYGDIALTMDGKINASRILTGELNANLIKTGKIQSLGGQVYFDLEAHNGKGELAASVLKSVEPGVSTTATIGSGQWSGGESYQGLRLLYTGDLNGECIISLADKSDYTLAYQTSISARGDLFLRSNAVSTNPGGNNFIGLKGNGSTGEGTIIMHRGARNGSVQVFISDNAETQISRHNNYVSIRDHTLFLYHDKK